MVLSNCPAGELHNAAEKILETARETAIDTLAGPIHVTVSIGAVAYPEAVRTPSDAMTKADIALQQAKRDGRNTWSIYRYTEAQRDGFSISASFSLDTETLSVGAGTHCSYTGRELREAF